MLGLANRLKAKFLLASMSEVYGDPEVHPQPENYRGSVNPIGLEVVMTKVKELLSVLVSTTKECIILIKLQGYLILMTKNA